MSLMILFRFVFQGLILLDYLHIAWCNKFFFNGTSQIQVTAGVIPLNSGFDFSFRTCKGGVLLSQRSNNNGFFRLEVVPTTVNYSYTPDPLFIRSHLKMTWNINGVRSQSVTLGTDLDKNYIYKVQFTPGSGAINSTLSLDGLTQLSVDVPNSILGFASSGPLNAGLDGGEGFVGCIESGRNIQLTDSVTAVNIRTNCTLDYQLGCPAKVCPVGFTGYYCEVNIDDCLQAKCHDYSDCVDLIGNYRCSCGPRWTGRHCDTFLGSLCNGSVCQNGGICRDTHDKNNYTCTCQRGYTGRNCELQFDPCDSSPCKQGGTCSNLTLDDFQCDCPAGFRGKTCNININDCLSSPCGEGSCIDGINGFTCNCTGSGYTGSTCSSDIDECKTNNPCHPNATCINHLGAYQCNCQDGFRGKNCYENIDDCHNNPCKNGGTCQDKVNGYNCNCTTGFNGSVCEHNIDDCGLHTCSDYQDCQDGVNNYTCVCKPGYTGVNCTTDINECDSSPCQNGGTCTDGINSYNCSCPSRYNGTNCELDTVDDCIGHTCLNNASCVDLVNDYNCSCLPGYEGPRCEIEADECLSSPCLHNGTCVDKFNNFTCNCTTGFTGHTCEKNIDDCAINPCKNNATCVDGVNHRTCYCPAEFYGDDCDKLRDACHPNPCGDSGNCSFAGDSYNCSCFAGFEGINCSVNIEDCKNDSCVSNATCIDGVNNYTCQCQAGYYGEFCHLEIKECNSNPCRNNATCIDMINGYNCSCAAGFNGTLCGNNIDDCPSNGCNNGTCIDGIDNFTCSCNPGYTGQLCENDVDECASFPCNCGTCLNTPGSYRCNCDQKFTGEHCEHDVNECDNKSLCSVDIRQGYCDNVDATTQNCGQSGFNCFCVNGFQGLQCEKNIDDCAGSPCKNGANCSDHVFYYNCTCAPGWEGRNCDEDIDECDLRVCQNGANCTNTGGSYSCECVPGYTNKNCSTDINECALLNPCVHGSCNHSINDYNCSCFPGFEGRNCSEDIKECDADPCQNGGTCSEEHLIADFNCTCPSNYTGKSCEIKKTSCQPNNPCLNNGTCKLHAQGFNYTCECAPGFAGPRCENITTVGFSGSSFVKFQLNRPPFELSFQFRTTLSNGLLAADSRNNFLVFLDKGNVTVVFDKGVTKLSAGQTANLNNGLWHTVHINISGVSVSITVDNSSCGQHCEASSTRLNKQVNITDLHLGGSPFAPSNDGSVLYNLTGCIQDVVKDRHTVIPTDTMVLLVNTTTGCPRQEVCASNPCAHGNCVDEWIKYRCQCARRWIGPQCNTSLIPGTFGATEPLNVASSRRRRDIESRSNASFAKFHTNDTSFGASGELSFFIRTREVSGLVVLMADNKWNHIAVVIHEGALVVQVKLNNANSNFTVSGSENVSDGNWHSVKVLRNELRFDNLSQSASTTGGKNINLTVTYLGGVDDFSQYPDAYLVKAPFRGCLQDIRLNNKMFDFTFNNPSSFSAERYPLIDSHHLGEGCKGMNVCRSAPCGDGGFCKDLWNKYECDCKPRYGGSDCALYGCSLINLCPANTTCRDVGENYECVHPVTLNGSSSSAEFTFTSSANVTMDVSLSIRTRQLSAVLIEINGGSDAFFKMELSNGRVNVRFALQGETGIVSSDAVVNDGQWHNVVYNITNNQSYVSVDGSATSNSSRPPNGDITSLLRQNSVIVGQLVFKGCLDDIRIGGLLLPFVDYYNSTLNVSHVTPLKPHFNVSTSGVKIGCHSDDVCSLKPCVRGVCGDVWNLFTCACPEGWAGNVCNMTANMTCAHSPCVNGTCFNSTHVDLPTNQSQVSDVGYDMFQCNCTPGFEGKQCERDTKECVSDPCKNGANCTELHLNYTCTCVKGYTGRNCEKNIDDCAVNNCINNSTCNDGIDSYNCSCLSGFNGTFCELDIDECAEEAPYGPCNATGTFACNNTKGNFTCDCKQGYFGGLCEHDPSMTCELKSPCKNGNCSDNATSFSCYCYEGYNGTLCQFDIHECGDAPCFNNGTCIDSHVNSTVLSPVFPGYKCECTVDYTGKQCEKKIDLCEEEPCKNNATCERLAYNEYRCNCTPDYKGENCTIFKPCYSQPCRNGATCHPTYYPVSNYTCTCALGYYGRDCENVTDYCSPDPCRNNATCENLNTQGKYQCNCTEGFGNLNCSGRVANCIPDPCVHGTCIPLMDSYLCECNPGYKGINCGELINKCESNPCQHGGTCETLPDAFKCDCVPGWVGNECQFEDPCVVNPCLNGATCKVFQQFGNFSCVCPEDFTGERCQTSLGPTSDNQQSDPSPLLIGGVVVASVLAILFLVLLVVLLRKRASNGTYSPSKEEGEAGRVELDAMLKPPPLERLI